MGVVGTVYGTEYMVDADEADRMIAVCGARGDLFGIRRTWTASVCTVAIVSNASGRELALFTASAG